jgi:hypothetical protein
MTIQFFLPTNAHTKNTLLKTIKECFFVCAFVGKKTELVSKMHGESNIKKIKMTVTYFKNISVSKAKFGVAYVPRLYQ